MAIDLHKTLRVTIKQIEPHRGHQKAAQNLGQCGLPRGVDPTTHIHLPALQHILLPMVVRVVIDAEVGGATFVIFLCGGGGGGFVRHRVKWVMVSCGGRG